MSAGLPYLGSKISLISQSDVRYEGILYTIDTVANTVALAKVRSFGTEDRPTDRPMAPREEEYEYIIFRATDLKDIRVLEPPNSEATLQGGLASDPAIVKHSKGGPVSSKHGYGAIGSQNSPEDKRSSGISSGDLRRSSKEDSGGSKNRSRQNSQSSGRGQSGGRGAPSPGQAIGFHRGGRGGSRGGGIGLGGGGQHRNNQSIRGRGGAGRGGFHEPGRPQQEKESLKFEKEYDFEEANVQFQEVLNKLSKTKVDDDAPVENGDNVEGLADNVENVEKFEEGEIEEGDEIYYDKQKSFFDSISCEALERSKGKLVRNDWRAEKRLNKETFGVTGSRSYGGGRGGFYYNRGGRGGYNQGGQGYSRGGYGRDGQGVSSRGFGGYNDDRGFGVAGYGRGRGGYNNGGLNQNGGQGGYRMRGFGGNQGNRRGFEDRRGGYDGRRGYDDREGGMDRSGQRGGGYARGGGNQGFGARRPYWGGVRNQ